jgi:hypothetical protein
MTLDRHTVVYETFMCMAPPGDSGCVPLKLKRGQQAIFGN